MTKREAAIVSAYTGSLQGSFASLQAYADELFGRPTLTHEFGDERFSKELQAKAKKDFCSITVE